MVSGGREFFARRYAQIGGKIVDIKLKPTIRVNTLRSSAKKIVPRLEALGVKLEKVPFAKHAYTVVSSRFSLGAISEYFLGYFALQEAAAQLPVQVLNPRPGELVLDMCAAPGMKSTQIAAEMKNQGTLVCYELKPHRVSALKTSLERLGVENAVVYRQDAVRAKKLGMEFDKVLLDAACSGNYLSEKDWLEKRDLDGIRRSAQIQRRLLRGAVDVLRPGGVLVYSTCALEPEENELNIQWALDILPVEIKDCGLKVGSPGLTDVFGQKLNKDIAKTRRFWPHITKTQGFYVAKLVRK